MSIGKKGLVGMMCIGIGMIISSCGSKGSSNEAVTRGAKVNPVVNSGGSAISSPVVGREIEVNPLVAKIDKEMERAGAYRAASETIMEGCVNRALNEGQDRIGMQERDVSEIEEALKEVEKMEEGKRKKVLKLFFQRAKSHCEGRRESFSVWEWRKNHCNGTYEAYLKGGYDGGYRDDDDDASEAGRIVERCGTPQEKKDRWYKEMAKKIAKRKKENQYVTK